MTIWLRIVFITIGCVQACCVAIDGKAHLDNLLHKLYRLFWKTRPTLQFIRYHNLEIPTCNPVYSYPYQYLKLY